MREAKICPSGQPGGGLLDDRLQAGHGRQGEVLHELLDDPGRRLHRVQLPDALTRRNRSPAGPRRRGPPAAAASTRRRAGSLIIDCNGMGKGSGPSGCSQASVQSDRSCRAGFPVRPRDRTVSLAVAPSIFSFVAGAVSASSVVSHTLPVHTPAAPSAIMAAIWAPLTMPPAASTGIRPATTSSTSGTQDQGRDGPGMPARLAPLGHDHVDAGVELAHGVLPGPNQGHDGHTRATGPFGH